LHLRLLLRPIPSVLLLLLLLLLLLPQPRLLKPLLPLILVQFQLPLSVPGGAAIYVYVS
jgi:hypothetical protein